MTRGSQPWSHCGPNLLQHVETRRNNTTSQYVAETLEKWRFLRTLGCNPLQGVSPSFYMGCKGSQVRILSPRPNYLRVLRFRVGYTLGNKRHRDTLASAIRGYWPGVVGQPSASTSRYNAASVIERMSAGNAPALAGSFRSARAAAIRVNNKCRLASIQRPSAHRRKAAARPH